MASPGTETQHRPGIRNRRAPLLANSVFGTLVFVVTEIIFFTALLSAILIIKAGTRGWEASSTGGLPPLATVASTGLLLLSGVYTYLAGRRFAVVGQAPQVRLLLALAGIMAALFVLIQSYEWLYVLRYGMSMASGMLAACLLLLIGAHGVHAVAALVLIGVAWRRVRTARLRLEHLQAMQIFWYFVVGIWPVLYVCVYF